MPDPPAGERGGAPSPAAVDRVTRFKPPGKLDLNSASLSSRGKRWKEEVELYMDLAMAGKDEKTKKGCFLTSSEVKTEKSMNPSASGANQMTEI